MEAAERARAQQIAGKSGKLHSTETAGGGVGGSEGMGPWGARMGLWGLNDLWEMQFFHGTSPLQPWSELDHTGFSSSDLSYTPPLTPKPPI